MRKEEELLVALRRVIRAVDLRSKQLSKHVGLTGPQLLVMQNIEERPGIMVREIAEYQVYIVLSLDTVSYYFKV